MKSKPAGTNCIMFQVSEVKIFAYMRIHDVLLSLLCGKEALMGTYSRCRSREGVWLKLMGKCDIRAGKRGWCRKDKRCDMLC
jgi:hypothetical protein